MDEPPSAPLPPRPDPVTGNPRPPQVPLGFDLRHSPVKASERGRRPTPPIADEPALEWYCRPRSWVAAGLILVIMVVPLTIAQRGLSWMGFWWFWPILAGVCLLAFVKSGERIAAGAAWFMYGRCVVRTYELTSVKLVRSSGGRASELELRDAHGGKAFVGMWKFQLHPRMWDLVYNGIRHSVRAGAETNGRVREHLRLP